MRGGTSNYTPVEQIIDAVNEWPGISLGPHPYDGIEFLLDDYEVGHVHHGWRSLHINYPRRMRDALIEQGEAERHPYFSNSGWTNHPVETRADVAHARRLLRLSYLYRASVLEGNPAAAAARDEIAVTDELDELGVSGAVRDVFEDAVLERA